MPKRLPLGSRSNMSAVMGSRPCGPRALVRVAASNSPVPENFGEPGGRRRHPLTSCCDHAPSISRHILPVGFWFASSGGSRCGRTSS